MQKRNLGSPNSAISAISAVSAIGLGCMGMSEFYGATDDAQAHSTLARALELGAWAADVPSAAQALRQSQSGNR